MIHLLRERAATDQINEMLEEYEGQDDLWGANWYPAEQRIAFESLINIRPHLGNRNILIQSQEVQKAVESVTHEILGGVR
jgi:Protein of unknown function (DUF5674)